MVAEPERLVTKQEQVQQRHKQTQRQEQEHWHEAEATETEAGSGAQKAKQMGALQGRERGRSPRQGLGEEEEETQSENTSAGTQGLVTTGQTVQKVVEVPYDQKTALQPIQKTVKIPLVQFSDGTLNVSSAVQRQAMMLPKVRTTVEVPQTQFVDGEVETFQLIHRDRDRQCTRIRRCGKLFEKHRVMTVLLRTHTSFFDHYSHGLVVCDVELDARRTIVEWIWRKGSLGKQRGDKMTGSR